MMVFILTEATNLYFHICCQMQLTRILSVASCQLEVGGWVSEGRGEVGGGSLLTREL